MPAAEFRGIHLRREFFVQPDAELIPDCDDSILIPFSYRIQMHEGRDAVDDNWASSVILVGVLVPDIDLVAIAQGDVIRVLASNEYTWIDCSVGFELNR